jgi:TatD DNase family protein
VSGYGEIGLDYVKKHAPPDLQRFHFAKQLELAKTLRLPVVIHDREAHTDTLHALEQPGCLQHGGIMHCFSGDYQYAKRVLDLGMLISIPGIVTFRNAHILEDVVKRVPLTAMILETDGPFLAPHPHRGKRNEPSFLTHTARRVAELKNIPIEEVAVQTSANAQQLFTF